MRVWALALTRNRAAADDLTQDVATKVLVAQDCFIPGTNFSAWVHRIMINHFIQQRAQQARIHRYGKHAGGRRAASHEDRTALRELGWALDRLPPDQREALSMIVLQEQSYEDAAEKTGCAIGTLKSRVHPRPACSFVLISPASPPKWRPDRLLSRCAAGSRRTIRRDPAIHSVSPTPALAAISTSFSRRVFVTVLGMDRFTLPEHDAPPADPHRLVAARNQVHLDPALAIVPHGIVTEMIQVEIRPGLAVQPPQQIEVECRGHTAASL